MDFHNRQYDPQLGRFLSVDPLADAGGQQVLSPYHAMGCNPVSMVDPLGLKYFGPRENVQSTAIANAGFHVFDDGTVAVLGGTKTFDYQGDYLDQLEFSAEWVKEQAGEYERASERESGVQQQNESLNGQGVEQTNEDKGCKNCPVSPFTVLDESTDNTKDMTALFDEQLKRTEKFFKSKKAYWDKLFTFYAENGHLTASLLNTLNAKMLAEFASYVATNSEFDIKNNNNTPFSNKNLKGVRATYRGETFRVDDFGNYNFGVAARAFGLGLNFSQAAAGLYQIYSGTSDYTWIRTYFDDPRDNMMIERGYKH